MKKLVSFFMIFFAATFFAQDLSQTFLPLKETGVEEFLKRYPEYDGRGTIIFILDTGVDMGIEGLTKTSTGEVKVIDVQDFTGQGDIALVDAEIDEGFFVSEDEKYKIAGADKLNLSDDNGKLMIGAINEKLWLNSGSGASDVNGNEKFDDVFHVVVFKSGEGETAYWSAYVDTDADGDLSDEKPLRDYKVNFDSFEIPNAKGLPNFTIGINIFPNDKKISFHFDDGAHGTHCAGIAAGFKIGNNDLNGVAPGSKVISLKLGNNNYSGGSTVSESMKKAYLYADKISREVKEPCIINMSFGIGSEIEGHADMEKFLHELAMDNPYLYICTSNGNEGPGISTAGLPAAEAKVFSTGAVLTKSVGADLYGAQLESDKILYFSSRGGEVSKPDVVSPGACTSTVPAWETRDRYWGTSMASPYSTGVMALLLSAAKVEFPDVKVPSFLLYKAVKEGASKLEGYNHLDQGSGYINVLNAYELLKKYIKAGEIEKLETYTISAVAPQMPDGEAPNIYIRNGAYLTGKETLTFTVNRDNFIDSDKFYRTYTLESDQDWLIPIQTKTYLRNDQNTDVNVRFDIDKIKEPGLYNGKIKAYRADNSKFPEFEMMATIVMPYDFSKENNYKLIAKGSLGACDYDRYYLNIPAGTTALKIKLTSDAGKYTSSRFFLHDPDGREAYASGLLSSEEEEGELTYVHTDLYPGIYELVVNGFFLAKDKSNYNLIVDVDGIDNVSDLEISKDDNGITLINIFDEVRSYSMRGQMLGYKSTDFIKLENKDRYEHDFFLYKSEKSKTFEIDLEKEEFNKVTDFAVIIYDTEGKAVKSDALGYRKGSISVSKDDDLDSVKYKLVLLPAFANSPYNMKIKLTEVTEWKNSYPVKLSNQGNSRITLYPSIAEKIFCMFSEPDINYPKDSKIFGRIDFISRTNSNKELELPIYFKF